MKTIREIVDYIIKREAELGIDYNNDEQMLVLGEKIDSELYAMGVTEEQLDEANDLYCNELLRRKWNDG